MNERIRELAEVAKPRDCFGELVRGLNSEYHDYWMEKFAELIIKECQFAIISRTDRLPEERQVYFEAIAQHFNR